MKRKDIEKFDIIFSTVNALIGIKSKMEIECYLMGAIDIAEGKLKEKLIEFKKSME